MSLHQKYDLENIFAKIITGDMPAVKIDENDDALAFMDIFPQSEGHCLVIPKNVQATNFFDIPADELQILIANVQRIAKAVEKALNPDGVRIVQFNGSEAGQTVFHIHFHIIPIYAGKGLGGHGGGKPMDADVLQPLAEKIAAAL